MNNVIVFPVFDGVVLEPEYDIEDDQLDANKDDEYLGQISDEEAMLLEHTLEAHLSMPCAFCINCGCIDNGGKLCNQCKNCKCHGWG